MIDQRKKQTVLKRRSIAYFAGALLLAAGIAAPATADPVRVTSGVVSIGGEGGLNFSFGATDFSVEKSPLLFPLAGTGLTAGCLDGLFGCAPGAKVSFTTLTKGKIPLGTGNAVVNGQTYNDIDLEGFWSFKSDGVTLPSTLDDPFMTIRAPFTFLGSLIGSRDGQELFRTILIGGGDASADIMAGRRRFRLDEQSAVVYTFAAAPEPSPVPEPASMFLIGTGLAGLAAARRRRRTVEPVA